MTLVLGIAVAAWLNAGEALPSVVFVRSSHQDIAWMDTPAACRRQRAAMVGDALDQMARDPGACFTVETTQYLAEALEDLPHRREEILARTREGRLDWGATWNQPYESLLSGEQLVRQVLLGRGWAARVLQLDLATACNPDVPARAWQWPQVLARSGVRHLYSGRHAPGLYRWAAPDGSSVLAWSGGHYNQHWRYLKKGTEASLAALAKSLPIWSAKAPRIDGVPWLLIPASEDGSGANDLTPLRLALREAKLAQAQEMTLSRAFSAILPHQAVQDVVGERPNPWLYIHGPGHVRAVTDLRASARLLPQVEALAVLLVAHGLAPSHEAEGRTASWRDAMASDHGWGGRHGEQTDAVFAAAHARARTWAENMVESSLERIRAAVTPPPAGHPVLVWNGLPWPRGGLVGIPLADDRPKHLVDSAGRHLPGEIQRDAGGSTLWVRLDPVPALGWTVYGLAEGAPAPAPTPPGDDAAAPGTAGGIAIVGHGPQARPGTGTVCHLHTTAFDVGTRSNGSGTAGDPSPEGREGTEGATWTLEHDGPLLRRWTSRATLGQAVVVRRLGVERGAGTATLEIDLLGWTGQHGREWRLDLGLDATAATVHYAVPFGHARLGAVETTLGAARPPQSQREVLDSLTVADADGRALTIALDGMPVCDLRPDGRGVQVEPVLLASRKSCHAEGPWYAQAGDHRFRVGWIRHDGGAGAGWRHGLASTHPLRVVAGPVTLAATAAASLPASAGLLRLDGPDAGSVCVTTVKPAEDGHGWVVRLVEMNGRPAEVVLRPAFPFSRAGAADLLENPLDPVMPEADGGLRLRLGRHEIRTVRLFPAR